MAELRLFSVFVNQSRRMTDRLPSDRARNLPPPTQDLVQGFIPAELLHRTEIPTRRSSRPQIRTTPILDPFR